MALVAAATCSNKLTNEDAWAVIKGRTIHGVIIADGVGSHYKAELGSSSVVKAVRSRLETLDATGPVHIRESLDFRKLLHECALELKGKLPKLCPRLPEGANPENILGTTVVLTVEIGDRLFGAYIGNGALLRIRGSFSLFPASYPLPWAAANYLVPHAVPVDGRALLDRVISPARVEDALSADEIAFAKDPHYGDVIVVCSDGILSSDQAVVGRDEKGRLWVGVEPALLLLFDYLRDFLRRGTYHDEQLQCELEAYLTDLNRRGWVEDDCTVGVLITDEALEFHRTRFQNQGG